MLGSRSPCSRAVTAPMDRPQMPTVDTPPLARRCAMTPAKAVTTEASAMSAPVWWYVEIQDDSGGEVRTDWVAATAATETILWDARGADGVVVENGDYDLRVRAMDANLNQGLVCNFNARIDASRTRG